MSSEQPQKNQENNKSDNDDVENPAPNIDEDDFEDDSEIQEIGVNAFQHCVSLIEVIFELPSSVNNINESAFEGCISLEKVLLPTSLSTINEKRYMKSNQRRTIHNYE